MNKIFLECFVT